MVSYRQEARAGLLTFSLDRIVSLTTTDRHFEMDERLNAKSYFNDCFGVMKDESVPAERIVIRAFGTEADYLRDLKMHSSQREVAASEDFADFELFLRPSKDFMGKLKERGDRLKVLSPIHLAEEMSEEFLNCVKLYEKT